MTRSERTEISAFLCLDQASVSGVALGSLRDGVLRGVQSGTAKHPEHRVRMIQAARQRAGCMCYVGRAAPAYPCPCSCDRIRTLAVVMEDHSGIPASAAHGTPTLLGMGDARGRWREDLAHMGHPTSMLFDVDMPTWRGTILGPRFARARKEVVKPEAVRWANARTRRDDVGEDEAEALCILHWAADHIPAKLAAARLQRDLFADHGRRG